MVFFILADKQSGSRIFTYRCGGVDGAETREAALSAAAEALGGTGEDYAICVADDTAKAALDALEGFTKTVTAEIDGDAITGFTVTDRPEPEPSSLESVKAAKLSEIAAARFAAETAGVSVGDVTVATDRESQALITGAALAAINDATYACQWKTESGFVQLTAEMIISIASAVRAHVQACFDREAELTAAVNAAATAADVQAVTWSEVS